MRAFRPDTGASLVPWLIVVTVAVLAGGVIFKMTLANQAQAQEIAALRAEINEVEAHRAEAQDLPRLRALALEMEALKKDAGDVPRLRGEVSRLRTEQQQLVRAQAEVQRLQGALQQQQAQADQLRAQQAQAIAPAAAPVAPLNPAEAQAQADLEVVQNRAFRVACLAGLKQIAGAKATWALENRKTASDVPTDADLFGPQLYLRIKPICPAGGSYLLLPVDTKPACTINGHTL